MLPHIAQRVFNTPLMIHPAKAEVIAQSLSDRMGIASVAHANGQTFALADFAKAADSSTQLDRIGPVAVIEVRGTLVQRTGTLQPYSGMTGYDGLREQLDRALHDPNVQAIAFDIDSPGGEVAGCFDLVDAIYEARGLKPMWAILDECAYSAAYAIASACDTITVPRTGGAGSVGVITMHADFSRAIANAGINVSVIAHGAEKGDGMAELPLSGTARATIQAQIDALGELFVETVARNRSLAPGKVRALQAGTFLGAQAVEIGLVDSLAPPDQALSALLDTFSTSGD
jgi:signal peptide peptidase SppA